MWKCGECRREFSVLTGTVMHGSKVSARIWVLVFFEIAASKNGVAREIERKYGVTPKTASFLLHRIREAMGNDGPVTTMRGVVVSDETHIGGKPKNEHRQGRKRPGTSRGFAGYPHHKVAVMTLVNKTTRQARSRVVRDVTGPTLAKGAARARRDERQRSAHRRRARLPRGRPRVPVAPVGRPLVVRVRAQ